MIGRRVFLTGCLFLFISCIGMTSFVLAQGSWDIRYTSIDSIDKRYIGKEVRLDFKGNQEEIIKGNFRLGNIRLLLSREDTTELLIDTKMVTFVERWQLYPDQGVLNDQYLISLDKKKIVRKLFIESIEGSTMLIKAYFYTEMKRGYSHEIPSNVKFIEINKKEIKGILHRALIE